MHKLVAITILLLAVISMSSQGSTLDDARNAGQVMETPDGYVTAKGDVPRQVKALVADVNKRRLAAYKKIAVQNNVSVEEVASESYLKRKKKAKRT